MFGGLTFCPFGRSELECQYRSRPTTTTAACWRYIYHRNRIVYRLFCSFSGFCFNACSHVVRDPACIAYLHTCTPVCPCCRKVDRCELSYAYSYDDGVLRNEIQIEILLPRRSSLPSQPTTLASPTRTYSSSSGRRKGWSWYEVRRSVTGFTHNAYCCCALFFFFIL